MIKELKLDLLGKIKKPEFQVRRKMLSKILEGELASNTKGQGIEFSGYRKYDYGDDASTIDWPASLRAKTTLIREFEQYRNFQIYILLDVSDSMLFSSTEQLKVEYAAEIAFSIVYSVVNSGSKVGMSMFNDKLVTKRIPNSGSKNYFRIIQDLTNGKNYGGNFDLRKPLSQSRALLFDKSLIIVISDFLGLKKGWNNYISMMSQQFDILAIMVRDPRDKEIPDNAGQFYLEDPFSKEKIRIDTKEYAKIYREMVKKEEEDIQKKFLSAKSGFVSVSTTEDFLKPLLKYVRLRAKILSRQG